MFARSTTFNRHARALLTVCAALLTGACTAPETARLGQRVPAWSAPDLAGRQLSLNELRGEVVLLNVWATWCYPCRREMPALEELHRELGGHGLRVVAVSVDAAGASGEIRAFLDEYDLTFDVLHDARGSVSRVFSTRGVPETFLIAADGTLLRHWMGRIDARSPGIREPVHAALAQIRRRAG